MFFIEQGLRVFNDTHNCYSNGLDWNHNRPFFLYLFCSPGAFYLKVQNDNHVVSYDENIVRRGSCFVPVSESLALEM